MEAFWNLFIEFFSLADPNVRWVVTGAILIGACSASIGTYAVLRKRALIGDVIAHSILPGICLGFILFQNKNPLILITAAFISGWLSIYLVNAITKNSKLKADAAMGIVLSVFFGLGIVLLTSIQQSGLPGQSGLDSFLFGKAAAITRTDILTYSVLCGFLILALIVFNKAFALLSFDRVFAETIGLPWSLYQLLLSSITVLIITIGVQSVGVVLMASLLITPAIAARFWTDHLNTLLLLAAFFGALASIFGAFISFLSPSMPTGPWIVVVLTSVAFLSMMFSPKKGWFFKYFQRERFKKNLLKENVLKTIYLINEGASAPKKAEVNLAQIQERRKFLPQQLPSAMKSLARNKYVKSSSKNGWKLTERGVEKAQKLVRIHRLWELYMNKYLKIPSDHVHNTAETLEHILTPEIEAELTALLKHPKYDPHQSKIPYPKQKKGR